MKQSYKRKQFYFRDSTQGKYILGCFIIAGLVAILHSLLLIFFSGDILSLHYDHNGLALSDTPSILMNIILGIDGVLIFMFGALIIFAVTRYTHRSAGPIHKISQTLQTMAKGDITHEIHLRKNDEHKDMAEAINQINTAIHEKISEIEQLSTILDKYLSGEDLDDPPLVLAQDSENHYAHPLQSINKQLKSSLSFFTTSDKRNPK